MAITHVCLSDLHCGASTSLLTAVDAQGRADYRVASPAMKALFACLHDLVGSDRNEGVKPTLVLAGDVLELALASTNDAAMTFAAFLDLAFPKGGEDLFAPEIVCVPGNHDHHLWERAREQAFLVDLGKVNDGRDIGDESHVTTAFRPEGTGFPEQPLLVHLANGYRGRSGATPITVSTAYPNYAIATASGERIVVFTHGHFVEPLYTAISRVKSVLFPTQEAPKTVNELETENFAWIDFFWSTLGRSGSAGQDVQRIYEMLGTDVGRLDLGRRLAHWIAEEVLGHGWFSRWLERIGLRSALAGLLGVVASHERGVGTAPLSETATDGLVAYMSGPLLRQLAGERAGAAPPDPLTVVFGHTHKPFEKTYTVHDENGHDHRIDVYNTGGWVVDTVEREPLHGGATVLVDDACHCATLRMYNESGGDAAPPSVAVHSLEEGCPLVDVLEKRVHADGGAFAEFAKIAKDEVALRARFLAKRSS